MKTLYIFTTNFPFANSENFLEEEIKYLSKRFYKIVILSFINVKTSMRDVPSNCEVINIPLRHNRLLYILGGIFHPRTFIVTIKEFFRSKVYLSKVRFRSWGASVRYINNCLYNRKLRSVIFKMTPQDVCYFYWGIGQCLLSIILKDKVKLISRFHGEWDLWEESYGGFHSLRTEVAHSLDKAVFIAKKGEKYFKTRYPYAKTIFSPLGTRDCGVQLPPVEDGVIRVLSCSSVIPLKRVSLIFDALNQLSEHKVEWYHIGDGPLFAQLQRKILDESKPHLKVRLLGRYTNAQVLEFYATHHFDMFINLSTTEGVPVAIMEAMSFDIPVLATDVGCTSEAVNKCVGELLPSNPSINEIKSSIERILSSQYAPREYWMKHYNAEINYSSFAEMLYNL